MSMVPVYAFLRHLGKVLDFHGENPVTCDLTFTEKIKHRFALGDIGCDNHTERGKQVYIYIHHAQCKPYSRDEDEWYMA